MEAELKIKSSVFRPDDIDRNEILYKVRTDGKKLYRVHLYIDGNVLYSVKNVRYRLHRTFSPNVVNVKRNLSNIKGMLTIWTWGLFVVEATVTFSNGKTKLLKHKLDFDKELRENIGKLRQVEDF